jgi:broad specificity phosphatase PhoE
MGPEVTLIRHGETEWSRSGQHTGRTDLPLTAQGEAEAKATGATLSTTTFDLVLVSPRQRARRTAELAGLGDGETVDDLQEWDYGDFEGMTSAEIQEQVPDWTIWDGPWPGGETAEEVGARADRVIARCLAQPDGTRIALVAHGHILRVLGARWIDLPVQGGRHLSLGTAALCRLACERDQRVLQLWNALPAAG